MAFHFHKPADFRFRAGQLADLAAPIYYSAGPPGLVEAMREVLGQAGINEDDVVTEESPGY